MKKLKIISTGMADATSWWRAIGPFAQIKIKGWQIDHLKGGGYSWVDFAADDIIFFQRPYNGEHLRMIEMLKDMQKPIWLDYDDDFLNVPISNSVFRVYASEKIRETLIKIVGMADYITVTTEALKNRIQPYTTAKIEIVRNAWNDYLCPWQKKPYKRFDKIMWRGGPSHDEDIDAHLPSLSYLAKDKRFEWLFFGNPNYRLLEVLDPSKYRVIYPVENHLYNNLLTMVEAGIGIVPLKDNVFNKSKSNIAWLEYTFAGAATLAPEWPEWYSNNMAGYDPSGPDDLAAQFYKSMENWEKYYEESHEDIQEFYLLSKVNKQRREIIEEIGECHQL